MGMTKMPGKRSGDKASCGGRSACGARFDAAHDKGTGQFTGPHAHHTAILEKAGYKKVHESGGMSVWHHPKGGHAVHNAHHGTTMHHKEGNAGGNHYTRGRDLHAHVSNANEG